MSLTGSGEDVALCGGPAAAAEGVRFALGGGDGDVVFLPRGDGRAGRVVAPAGDGLWRRAPWPVADALFDLPAAENPRSVAVVGETGREIADRLAANGLRVAAVERLTLGALRSAAVVVLLGGHGALPAQAPAVLAARRVLVTDATEVTFGLQSGIEFLLTRLPGEAVERATMACLHARATAGLRVMGARAAGEHRASVVYARLAGELEA